jgi:hypothetical protein
MITGYWVTQIIHGAAHFSLADHLKRQPMTAPEFAKAEGIDRAASIRFLRACAAVHLVKSDGFRFFTTGLLDTLRRDRPQSLRGFALSQPAPGHWLPWGRFIDALRTGERQTVATLNAEIFDYYGTVPAEAAAFTEAMSGLTAAVTTEVNRLLDTTGFTRAVDIGGAAGSLLFSIMRTNPLLEGVVFDLPNVIPGAMLAAQQTGLGARVEVIAGDFFDSVPEGDLYLLKYILHDWDDESCLTILRNCRRAARPNSQIVVIEQLLDANGFTPLMDLNMMVMLTGRERTEDEYGALLADAGFGKATVTRTNTLMVILTATPV